MLASGPFVCWWVHQGYSVLAWEINSLLINHALSFFLFCPLSLCRSHTHTHSMNTKSNAICCNSVLRPQPPVYTCQCVDNYSPVAVCVCVWLQPARFIYIATGYDIFYFIKVQYIKVQTIKVLIMQIGSFQINTFGPGRLPHLATKSLRICVDREN